MEIVISAGFGVWLVITALAYKRLTRPASGSRRRR